MGYIIKNGTKTWKFAGKVHREGEPAVVSADGTKIWCVAGLIHREDGPAVQYPDGRKEYWFCGKKMNYMFYLFFTRLIF